MAAFMHRLGNNPAFVNGGNAFGTNAVLGPTDNQPLDLQSHGFWLLQLAVASNANYGLTANVVGGFRITVPSGWSGPPLPGADA
jgi:hypothetical protein